MFTSCFLGFVLKPCLRGFSICPTLLSFGLSHGCPFGGRRAGTEAAAVNISFKSSGIKWDPNAKIDIHCGNGHPMQVTLGDLQRNATVTCPVCGQRVHLDATQFNRDLDKAVGKIKDIFK